MFPWFLFKIYFIFKRHLVDLWNYIWTNVLFASLEKWIILFLSNRIKGQQEKDTKSLLRKFSFVKKKKMAFSLAWLDRKVGFNLEWLMRFRQAPWLYHHCSLSVQQPGKPGRHSVAQNHSLGKKLAGRTSARYLSMALSLGYWQFKRLNQKYVCLGDTNT